MQRISNGEMQAILAEAIRAVIGRLVDDLGVQEHAIRRMRQELPFSRSAYFAIIRGHRDTINFRQRSSLEKILKYCERHPEGPMSLGPSALSAAKQLYRHSGGQPHTWFDWALEMLMPAWRFANVADMLIASRHFLEGHDNIPRLRSVQFVAEAIGDCCVFENATFDGFITNLSSGLYSALDQIVRNVQSRLDVESEYLQVAKDCHSVLLSLALHQGATSLICPFTRNSLPGEWELDQTWFSEFSNRRIEQTWSLMERLHELEGPNELTASQSKLSLMALSRGESLYDNLTMDYVDLCLNLLPRKQVACIRKSLSEMWLNPPLCVHGELTSFTLDALNDAVRALPLPRTVRLAVSEHLMAMGNCPVMATR